jgi:hypothetical protein
MPLPLTIVKVWEEGFAVYVFLPAMICWKLGYVPAELTAAQYVPPTPSLIRTELEGIREFFSPLTFTLRRVKISTSSVLRLDAIDAIYKDEAL